MKKIKPPKSASSTLGIIYAFLRCAVDFYLEWAGQPSQSSVKKSARSSEDVGFSTQSDTVSELSAIIDGATGYKTPDSSLDPITFRNSVSSEMSQGRSTIKSAEMEQKLSNFLDRKLRALQPSAALPRLERIAFEKRGEWLGEFLKKLDSEIENDYTYMSVQTWIENATEDNNYRRLIKTLIKPPLSEQNSMDQLKRSEELLQREKERLAWILDKVSNL